MTEKIQVTLTNTGDHRRTWHLKIGGAVTLSGGETSKPIWMLPDQAENLSNSGLRLQLCEKPEPEVVKIPRAGKKKRGNTE